MSNLSQFFGGGAKVWVSGATYAVGDVVMSPANQYQPFIRAVAGAGTTDPSSDATNWRPLGARAIKSIQRGTIGIASGALSATATISAVDTAKTRVRYTGTRGLEWNADTAGAVFCTVALTNSTTLTANRGEAVANTAAVSYEVEEFY